MPIELSLSLTVVLGGFGMRAPIGFLIIGMLGAPLLLAVQYHLGIHRVGLNLVPVVIGPSNAAGTLAGCKRAAGVGTGMDESFAGSTDSSGSRSMRLLRNRKGFQLLSKADNGV